MFKLSWQGYSHLASIEKNISVDLTGYAWRTDSKYFISTPERVHTFKKTNGSSHYARIIYLPKDRDKVDAFLKNTVE